MYPWTHGVIERNNIMTSNAKKTKAIRANKIRPNKSNQKTDKKRDMNNREILKGLAEKDKK